MRGPQPACHRHASRTPRPPRPSHPCAMLGQPHRRLHSLHASCPRASRAGGQIVLPAAMWSAVSAATSLCCTTVTATPSVPKRPARPRRCMYVDAPPDSNNAVAAAVASSTAASADDPCAVGPALDSARVPGAQSTWACVEVICASSKAPRLTTRFTCSRSTPLASRSVETSTRSERSRMRAIACARLRCVMLPVRRPAAMPAAHRRSLSAAAVARRRAKTTAWWNGTERSTEATQASWADTPPPPPQPAAPSSAAT